MRSRTIDAAELFSKLHETAKIFADFPPKLNDAEKEAAVTVARRIGAGQLLGLWEGYCRRKPGKRLSFFMEDSAHELQSCRPVTVSLFKCTVCGREVQRGLYLFDTKTCINCEREQCQDGAESEILIGGGGENHQRL